MTEETREKEQVQTSTDAGQAKGPKAPFKKKKKIPTNPESLELFESRVSYVRTKAEKGDSNAQQALEIAEKLQEPNLPGIYRLIHVFGREMVQDKADTAAKAYDEAKEQGDSAFQPSEFGTLVATRKGQPRTPGGILFYLIREHCEKNGINMMSLYIPQVPSLKLRGPEGYTKPPATEKPVALETKPAETTTEKPAATEKPVAPEANGKSKEGGNKPGRAKITITGRLEGNPRSNPQGLAGVVEIVVNTEMNTALPKGLPSLGATRVVIWVTEKSFRKAQQDATPQTRYLIEGEPMPAVDRDFKPFLRVMCTRFSNLDLEQARRAEEQAGKPEAPAAS